MLKRKCSYMWAVRKTTKLRGKTRIAWYDGTQCFSKHAFIFSRRVDARKVANRYANLKDAKCVVVKIESSLEEDQKYWRRVRNADRCR